MPIVSSMTPLHSIGHNNQNEGKHDLFSHLIPLTPALLSCEAKYISNDVILFNRQKQLKQGVT